MYRFMTLDCPHCTVARASMPIHGVQAVNLRSRLNVMLVCPACDLPIAVSILSPNERPSDLYAEIPEGSNITNPIYWVQLDLYIEYQFPKAQERFAPADVPAPICRVFEQAHRAAARRDFDAAAMAFRKVVDLLVKDIDPDGQGMLGKRLRRLKEERGLHPVLIDWADRVTLLGNAGAHDAEEPTAEDITDLDAFVETLLRYVYTMPARLKPHKSAGH
jgi:Domain of unknown function (DUF4145)